MPPVQTWSEARPYTVILATPILSAKMALRLSGVFAVVERSIWTSAMVLLNVVPPSLKSTCVMYAPGPNEEDWEESNTCWYRLEGIPNDSNAKGQPTVFPSACWR